MRHTGLEPEGRTVGAQRRKGIIIRIVSSDISLQRSRSSFLWSANKKAVEALP